MVILEQQLWIRPELSAFLTTAADPLHWAMAFDNQIYNCKYDHKENEWNKQSYDTMSKSSQHFITFIDCTSIFTVQAHLDFNRQIERI